MATVILTFRPNFDFHMTNPRGMVGTWLRDRGKLATAQAKAEVGVKTGRLRTSIKMTSERTSLGPKIEIGSKKNYALVHHEGARPHVIRARKGKALKFSSRGQIVYRKRVMHPGHGPNKYLIRQFRFFR